MSRKPGHASTSGAIPQILLLTGQLLSINNSKLSNDGGVTNNDNTDMFGMQFLYDKPDANLTSTAIFNGRLSAVKWMSKDAVGYSSYERSYAYHYDDVGRYYESDYAERATAGLRYRKPPGLWSAFR